MKMNACSVITRIWNSVQMVPEIIINPKKAAAALAWLVEEMEQRYQDMKASRVRHIDDFNAKVRSGEIAMPPLPSRAVLPAAQTITLLSPSPASPAKSPADIQPVRS